MASESDNIMSELARKHKTAANTVVGLIVAAVLLSVIAFVGKDHFREQPNGPLEMAAMLVVLFLGLGSIVWRRTKFAAMRLQDIGALQGPSGLLQTLEKTTLQIALFGAVIALIGFIATLLTGNQGDAYRATAVSLVVLLYCYPTKSSWTRVIQYYGNPEASSVAKSESVP